MTRTLGVVYLIIKVGKFDFFLCFFAYILTEVIDAMKKVAKLDLELTTEERNLLSIGHKNVLNARRASLRMLSSIEQKEEAKGNEYHVKHVKEYRKRLNQRYQPFVMI